jgi:hypothetical protein
LRVGLTFDSIGVAIDETIPRDFQITEVMLCPFDFNADEREPFVGGHISILVIIQQQSNKIRLRAGRLAAAKGYRLGCRPARSLILLGDRQGVGVADRHA